MFGHKLMCVQVDALGHFTSEAHSVNRKLVNMKCILFVLALLTTSSRGGHGALTSESETSRKPLVGLFNGLIDEALSLIQVKYLCGFDPLGIPSVTQDDLNISYSMNISQIEIQGLSHIFRVEDIQVTSGEVPESYEMSSKLGIRDVKIKFHVELLKILSLTVVDFIANGSLVEIDIPLQVYISPSQKSIQFDQLSIEKLDDLVIDLKHQNFLTLIGGWIPFVNKWVKTHIKESIKMNLESRIGDAKSYLNNILTSFASLSSNPCTSPTPTNSSTTNVDDGIRVTDQVTTTPSTLTAAPPPQYWTLTITDTPLHGLPQAYGLVIKYKSKMVGSIPTLGQQNNSADKSTKFFGYFDNEKNTFVLNNDGKVFRHGNTNPKDEKPKWTLTARREENFFCLYAQGDDSDEKIKLNPFITKNNEMS